MGVKIMGVKIAEAPVSGTADAADAAGAAGAAAIATFRKIGAKTGGVA